MILLAVADIHYDLRKLDWVTSMALHVDAVVIAGDHLDIAATVARPAQALLVQKYFRRIAEQTTLIVSSGNHDLDGADPNGEMMTRWIANARHFAIATDGDVAAMGDARITVCPWIDGEHQRVAQNERFKRDARDRPALWIWVYHSPPDGSCTSFGRGRSWGDDWLSEWIKTFHPNIALTGHVHEAPFSKGGGWVDRIGTTWVFNAGHQYGPSPSFVVIDTDAMTASWHSQAGTEQVDLTSTLAVEPHPIGLLDLPAQVGRVALHLAG